MTVLAEADGPVRSAFLDPRDNVNGCPRVCANRRCMGQGRVAFFMGTGEEVPYEAEAIIGGSVDELRPRVLWQWKGFGGREATASDQVWASSDNIRVGVARWGEPWEIVYDSSMDGLQQVDPKAFHDFVFWGSNNGTYFGLTAWMPGEGAYPFITYPGDWSQGAWGLGTDGVDMVWTHSQGKGPSQEPYPEGSVMTSPFTTDPALLTAHRVRSYPSPHWPAPQAWTVGCGYAAIEWKVTEVLVVRLSDGWSWSLSTPNPQDPPSDQWHFSNVYGLTCDEVFVRAGKPAEMNIARVRLDALGPGVAPD
jgi:hypothetical protein